MQKIKPDKKKNWIVYVSTFPPRECGIATFTDDLSRAFGELFSPGIESKVVALNVNEVSHLNYPPKVIAQISQDKASDYLRVAKELNNLPQVKLVSVQHEFGIFGGLWGSYLLAFLETIKKPVVVTFHSVLPAPDDKLKVLVKAIADNSFGIVVMTRRSKEILEKDYGIVKKKIQVVPHGIHPMTFQSSEKSKRPLGLSKKIVLSTFGLLSKDKGIEYVIESLPEVVKKHPEVVYLVIGATHPTVIQREGEKYRNTLIKKVDALGLSGHVKFYNRYMALHELLAFLDATDIYISPSLNPNQAVSGTLTYAMGAGRPVISTAFAQAKEDVPASVGMLVDFKKPLEYRDAILHLLADTKRREKMGEVAYFITRNMTWPNVAIAYMKVFSRAVPSFSFQEKNLPRIKMAHILKLTDDFGIFQFAKLTEVDKFFGYTTDDNARALIAACLHFEKFKSHTSLNLMLNYLNFLEYTVRPDGYFNNYVNQDRTLNSKANNVESMEDPTGRAIQALAKVAASESVPYPLREKSRQLLFRSLDQNLKFTHLRAMAFFIKGLCTWLSGAEHNGSVYDRLEAVMVAYCDQLVSAFKKNENENWKWFEPHLTYANAILPDALFSGYLVRRGQNIEWLEVGTSALEFLISKTFIKNVYVPIGQRGWHRQGGHRALYDQQPEEPAAMVKALGTAYMATKNDKYRKLMHRTFYWFLGDNLADRIMYDASTGGCYDGLARQHVNLNQGAESTLSYLIARLIL
ncbi:MAG: glycosyltransferase [Patescibacteria group bacterium]|nr:glycosyltransferase [bacterium]MDZ4240577.1 glycosyltransferase [Patescibacteria group bacterium]